MKLILVLFALFAGATLGSIELHEVGIADEQETSSAYMKSVLDQNSGVDAVMTAITPSAADVLDILPYLALTEAKNIADRVKLADIVRKNNLEYITLIAPSDAAIKKWNAKVGPEIADNIDVLTTLAKSWIVPNVAMSKSFRNDMKLQTLVANVALRINIYKSQDAESQVKRVVTVNGGPLILEDFRALGNVVHIMDKVAFPLPDGSVIDILAKVDEFSVIVDLIKTAGIKDELNRMAALTILAPTNKAFDKLPANFKDELKADATKLIRVLKYHLLPKTIYTAGVLDGQVTNALQSRISVDFEDDKIILNKRIDQATRAEVIYRDIPADNGVIQVIDQVMLPDN